MLIKHKIGLSFLVVFLLIGAVIAMELYRDVRNADQLALHEATAIAQTLAISIAHDIEHHASDPFGSGSAVQRYIEEFKSTANRDLFVVDANQKIIADVVTGELGTTFNHDPSDEVGVTLHDGKPRTFEEKNFMHPDGISQLVTPLDSSSGERLGALVLEYTPLHKEILAGIKKSAAGHMFFYAVFFSIALLGGYAFIRKLSVPLRDMRNAARDIAAGQEGVLIQYNARDELGELAAGFNKMAVDVAEVRKDLLEANERLKSDIETRQQTEEALVESEQKLRALLDAIPDMILFKDAEGRHQLANQAALNAFGGPEHIMGKTAEDLLPPEAAKRCRLNDEEVMRSHHLRQNEESIPGHEGETLFIDTIRVPLYDTQKKATGLVVIVRDITQQKVAEERILASLREKEVLLREIHHRVKNNLAVVISLLRLQSGRIESEEVRNVFIESQNRIKAMALVHEKLFSEAVLSKVNFESYVKKLVGDICRSLMINAGRVNTGFEIEDVLLDIDTLVPCGLIINELVTNALKHALTGPEPLDITIGLSTQNNDMLSLSVTDRGCGLPADIDVEHCQSLGLQIVQSLVTQIKGTMHVRRENGTRFDISFPKERKAGTNQFYTL